MKKKICVTKQHIMNGKQSDCVSCPIALAVHEQTDLGGVAAVIADTLLVDRNQVMNRPYRDIPLSRSARRFIQRFDKGLRVKPFNFIVDI